MTVMLDAAAEARIQQEIDCGTYRDASEVIAHALDFLGDDKSWSIAEKAEFANTSQPAPPKPIRANFTLARRPAGSSRNAAPSPDAFVLR